MDERAKENLEDRQDDEPYVRCLYERIYSLLGKVLSLV